MKDKEKIFPTGSQKIELKVYLKNDVLKKIRQLAGLDEQTGERKFNKTYFENELTPIIQLTADIQKFCTASQKSKTN